jgi:hypothetical protein
MMPARLLLAKLRPMYQSSSPILPTRSRCSPNQRSLEGQFPQASQELVLRALEQRKYFGDASVVLDALVRQVGLFPYLNPKDLGTADQIAWEFNHPEAMPDDIVFHEPQTRVYRELVQGHNVVLSAPTSFGKSLVTDAVIASGKFKNAEP